jgi:hypothetical protein
VICAPRQGTRLCACLMRRLLAVTTTILMLLCGPAALAADRPRDLLLDACRDERVDGTYSQRTYRRALDQLPADSDQYTACRETINRARLAALSARDDGGGGGGGGGGGSSGGGGGASSSGSSGGARGGGGASGDGTPDILDTATADERKAVEEATSSGAGPVSIGGRLLRPSAGAQPSAATNALPTSLTVLLAALGACALAAAGVAARNRVLARRAP